MKIRLGQQCQVTVGGGHGYGDPEAHSAFGTNHGSAAEQGKARFSVCTGIEPSHRTFENPGSSYSASSE